MYNFAPSSIATQHKANFASTVAPTNKHSCLLQPLIYLHTYILEECNALLASEHDQFNISRVFCTYLESRNIIKV